MTSQYTVDATCLRYVIPFKYNSSFDDAIKQMDAGNENSISWIRKHREDCELFSYVRDEFCFDERDTVSNQKVGYEWVAQTADHESDKGHFELRKLLYKSANPQWEVTISDAGILLFRNQLGLFWYELTIPATGLNAQQLKRFQQQVKHIGSGSRTYLQEEQIVGGNVCLKNFYLGSWVNETIPIPDISYFMEREDKHIPKKALLYTYAAFANECSDPYPYIYQLTNGYPDRIYISEETRRDIRQPFADAYWYATQEGVAYLAWPNPENKDYYNSDILRKIRADYFMLYLKVLYQSFSLLIYAEKIQLNISAIKDSHLPESEDQNISTLCSEINLFLAKSMATSVSHVHHQSEFYIYLKQRLRVHDDIKSVTAGLNALDVLHREQDKAESEKALREREERDKASDKKLERGVTILSFFGIFSALVDSYDFFAKFSEKGEYWELSDIWKCIEGSLSAAIGIAAIALIVWYIRTKKE